MWSKSALKENVPIGSFVVIPAETCAVISHPNGVKECQWYLFLRAKQPRCQCETRVETSVDTLEMCVVLSLLLSTVPGFFFVLTGQFSVEYFGCYFSLKYGVCAEAE